MNLPGTVAGKLGLNARGNEGGFDLLLVAAQANFVGKLGITEEQLAVGDGSIGKPAAATEFEVPNFLWTDFCHDSSLRRRGRHCLPGAASPDAFTPQYPVLG